MTGPSFSSYRPGTSTGIASGTKPNVMSSHKNQHAVTEAYLRGFADATSPNSLWRYDKTDGTVERKNVNRCAVCFYINSFRQPDGKWNHEGEHLFGTIEDKALPILKSVVESANSDHLSKQERNSLAKFMAASYRRTEAVMSHFHESGMEYFDSEEFISACADKWIAEARFSASDSEIKDAKDEFLQARQANVSDRLKATQLRHLFSHLEDGTNLIESLHWQVVAAKPPLFFITSDSPVFVRPLGDSSERYGELVHIADKDAELHFPLSRQCFLLARQEKWNEPRKASKSRVRELNSRTIRTAHTHIFAPRGDAEIKRLIDANRHISPMLLYLVPPEP